MVSHLPTRKFIGAITRNGCWNVAIAYVLDINQIGRRHGRSRASQVLFVKIPSS
jgi:hypothetical protein